MELKEGCHNQSNGRVERKYKNKIRLKLKELKISVRKQLKGKYNTVRKTLYCISKIEDNSHNEKKKLRKTEQVERKEKELKH